MGDEQAPDKQRCEAMHNATLRFLLQSIGVPSASKGFCPGATKSASIPGAILYSYEEMREQIVLIPDFEVAAVQIMVVC